MLVDTQFIYLKEEIRETNIWILFIGFIFLFLYLTLTKFYSFFFGSSKSFWSCFCLLDQKIDQT